MKLIHLTDTHLITPGQLLYGLDPLQRLQLAIASINTLHADADHVVITGDLTHWGESVAYESLRECLIDLKPRYSLILGNHDNRSLFRDFFPEAMRDVNGFVQDSFETEVGQFLFLDTNQPGTHAGWYCEQRLTWLAEHLNTHPDIPKYVFMHHPPFDVGLLPMDRIGLMQKNEFAAVLRPYMQSIRHIFFGHVHRPISGSWHGIAFSTLRATSHQVWLDFAATDDIPGSHEPAQYAVVLIDDERTVVHYHDFLDSSEKFSLAV